MAPRFMSIGRPHAADADAAWRRRAAPFAVVIVLCALSPAVPHTRPPEDGWWLAAGLVIAAAFGLGEAGVRWRAPRLTAIAPLLVLAAAHLLRAADGNGNSGFAAMVMLPILWYALYESRALVLTAIAGAAAVLLLPLVVVGAPQYPASGTRGMVLLLVVMAASGLTVQQLVAATLAAGRWAQTTTARFRAIFEHAPVGMALSAGEVTASSCLTMVNGSLCALVGRDDAEMVDTPFFELVHPGDLDDFLARAQQANGEPTEARLIDRAGHVVWTSVSCTAPQLADHAMDGQRVWQFDDITADRAAAETVMDLLNTERHTAQTLRTTEAHHRELLGAISHDLRTPITAALGYAELLADGEYGEMTPSQQRTAEVISRSLANLSRIINELVVIGPELARDDAAAGRVQVDALIEDAVHMVAISAVMRNQTVVRTGDPDGLCVTGDEALLNRVLVNLLANAVKFTPVGGSLTVAVARTGEQVAISVTDTGQGIPLAEQERIFERFYRAPRETGDPVTRGSGLGLAIVKAIVTQHRGELALSSTPGRGATFTVRLPLAAASDADRIAESGSPRPRTDRSRAVVSPA